MPRRRDSIEWTESATATNATATATHSGESNNVHFVTSLTATLTGSGNVADLTLSDGSTTLLTFTVHDQVEIQFPFPVKITTGNKAEAALGAGGTGVDGNVFLGGFTRDE